MATLDGKRITIDPWRGIAGSRWAIRAVDRALVAGGPERGGALLAALIVRLGKVLCPQYLTQAELVTCGTEVGWWPRGTRPTTPYAEALEQIDSEESGLDASSQHELSGIFQPDDHGWW